MDCSGDCGRNDCPLDEELGCVQFVPATLGNYLLQEGNVATVRTPHEQACLLPFCDKYQVLIPRLSGTWRVTVDAPWSLHLGADSCNDDGESCVILGGSNGFVAVATEDPQVPPGNVVIEAVAKGSQCP